MIAIPTNQSGIIGVLKHTLQCWWFDMAIAKRHNDPAVMARGSTPCSIKITKGHTHEKHSSA